MFRLRGPRNAPLLRVLGWDLPSLSATRLVRATLNMTRGKQFDQTETTGQRGTYSGHRDVADLPGYNSHRQPRRRAGKQASQRKGAGNQAGEYSCHFL